jgi:hypothetical protein
MLKLIVDTSKFIKRNFSVTFQNPSEAQLESV